MADKTIEEFFKELKNNEKGLQLFNSGKVETLDELVKVTGGVATTLGYEFSDDEILTFYNSQEALLRMRSDNVALGLADAKDIPFTDFKADCGVRQIMLEPHCIQGPYK